MIGPSARKVALFELREIELRAERAKFFMSLRAAHKEST